LPYQQHLPAAQRGGVADIRTPEEIVGTLDVLSEQIHGPVMRGCCAQQGDSFIFRRIFDLYKVVTWLSSQG